MNLERKFVIFMAVFIVMAMAYLFLKDTGGNNPRLLAETAENQQVQIMAQTYNPKATGTMGSGDVVVELTPRKIDNNILEVQFNLNTHSVSLSDLDFMGIAVLEHEDHQLKPVRASKAGGHHSSGVIMFDTEKKFEIKESFRIRLKGIPSIKERIYEWS